MPNGGVRYSIALYGKARVRVALENDDYADARNKNGHVMGLVI